MENKHHVKIEDPDYQTTQSAIRLAELKESNDENTETVKRISSIIEDEFDREIVTRQAQIERIEEQLYKAQKLLHIVRYVLISSYYNSKTLEYNEEEPSTSTSIFESQNRIHPAIKKLLGKNANPEEIFHVGTKRKIRKRINTLEPTVTTVTEEVATKKIKLEPLPEKIKEEKDNHVIKRDEPSMKSRNKSRQLLVVGNISKWMPSLEDENLTHKWMVYVRGPKETPDISHFVDKILFYLHSSYKPFDVVEVNTSPFHLTRRGWGEFSIRVQVFFKNPMNKPINITHQLKLDKSYTGRQTLGNETVVEILLHEEKVATIPEDQSEFDGNFFSKDEHSFKSELDTDIDLDALPLDFLDEGIINADALEDDFNFLDHDYSLPYSERDTEDKPEPEAVERDVNNSLIYGLNESYNTSTSEDLSVILPQINNSSDTGLQLKKIKGPVLKTMKTSTGKPICFLPQSFSKLLLSNGNLVTIKMKPGQTILKKSIPLNILSSHQELKLDSKKYAIELPSNKFKNMGEVLPYLFKRMPLVNELAKDINYKCLYPYTAKSMSEFASWHFIKRTSSEWSRAKAIRKFLAAQKFFELEKWNTKTILMYGRSHFFSPLASFSIFTRNSREKNILCTCFANENPLVTPSTITDGHNNDPDLSVDVISDEDNVSSLDKRTQQMHDISDDNLKQSCTFVRQTALNCGILLKSEEISEGVMINGAERMIYEAVKCLAENLVRRGANFLVCNKPYDDESSVITVSEIQMALKERTEIASITKFQKRKRDIDYFL